MFALIALILRMLRVSEFQTVLGHITHIYLLSLGVKKVKYQRR